MESLYRVTLKDEEHLGTSLLNPLENLESSDVGLNFQLKMLEFMDSMNQEIKLGKEKRA